jgi:hypothetical protein
VSICSRSFDWTLNMRSRRLRSQRNSSRTDIRLLGSLRFLPCLMFMFWLRPYGRARSSPPSAETSALAQNSLDRVWVHMYTI